MLAGMAVLAAGCVAVGVVPGAVVPALRRAAQLGLGLTAGSPSPVRSGVGLDLAGLRGAIEPALLLGALLVGMAVVWGGARLVAQHSPYRSARRAEAWGCGRELQTARMEYTATSFAEPLQRVFADVLRPDHDVEVTHAVESRFFRQGVRYHRRVDDAIERSAYRPVIRLVSAWGGLARRVPNGSTNRYLAYGFVALVVVLVVLA